MKTKFFMNVMSRQLVNIWQRLEGMYCFYLKDQAVLEEKLNSWIMWHWVWRSYIHSKCSSCWAAW